MSQFWKKTVAISGTRCFKWIVKTPKKTIALNVQNSKNYHHLSWLWWCSVERSLRHDPWNWETLKYRVYCQLLRLTVQLNVSYYDNKQDHSKSSHTDRMDNCKCALICLHLNDHAYCYNKTHLTEQSFLVAGHTPCKVYHVNCFTAYHCKNAFVGNGNLLSVLVGKTIHNNDKANTGKKCKMVGVVTRLEL